MKTLTRRENAQIIILAKKEVPIAARIQRSVEDTDLRARIKRTKHPHVKHAHHSHDIETKEARSGSTYSNSKRNKILLNAR
jgi:hypothetical protein